MEENRDITMIVVTLHKQCNVHQTQFRYFLESKELLSQYVFNSIWQKHTLM